MQRHLTFKIVRLTLAFILFVGVAAPLSAVAQTSSIRYGRVDGTTNAYFLLPNRGYFGEYSSQGNLATGMSVSCAPMKLTAGVGESVIWFSSVTGGQGYYDYAWNGTDILLGNASSVEKIYTTGGEKFATLTVTSGAQTVTVSCGGLQVGPRTSSISVFIPSGFGASCYAVPERSLPGESVTWLSIVSGGNASTTYAWDGTDGLASDRPLVSKTYTTLGVKAALLTVTSGNSRIVAACTNSVRVAYNTPVVSKPAAPALPPTLAPEPVTPDVQGICGPSSNTASLGDEVFWQGVAIGGNDSYSFAWDGDESLSGNASTTLKKYESAGMKNATMTVTSGEKTAKVTCVPVQIERNFSGQVAAAFLSFISGPFGLILGIILAILIGVLIARRRKAQEEAENKEDEH
ncbi:MAG: hypothetical protein Q7R93_01475 [bacterium]|nr:hypothetical protein [bacterium]